MPTDDPQKQAAHDKLQDLLDTTNAAYAVASPDQRDRLSKIADATSASITQLNRLDMQSRTGDFQASEEPLNACIKKLNTLKSELTAVSNGFAQAAEVCTAIDKAASEVSLLFAV